MTDPISILARLEGPEPIEPLGRMGPIPAGEALTRARRALEKLMTTESPSDSSPANRYLPTIGRGYKTCMDVISEDILPGLPNQSSQYYGFVTGGTTPAARAADYLVTCVDANVQVHLQNESIATEVEEYALRMLLELLGLNPQDFPGRTLTTGATASNVLGLVCAREYLVDQAIARAVQKAGDGDGIAGAAPPNAADLGIFRAMQLGQIQDFSILTAACHSSAVKAASIAGFGRNNVVNLGSTHDGKPWTFDLAKLEERLLENERKSIKSIVMVNFGEVNTGQYTEQLPQIRTLCDRVGAWMHVDGAFGIYLRTLALSANSKYYQQAVHLTEGLELADSITGDNHKTLNVPYDSGFFLTKHPHMMYEVFRNAGAPYLSSGAGSSQPDANVARVGVPDWAVPQPERQELETMFAPKYSPLDIGIENSRRFRALPIFATLLSYGLNGYTDFIERIIDVCRDLAKWIDKSSDYELLLPSVHETWSIVLFRAKDAELNDKLQFLINRSRDVYVSATKWEGRAAIRVAPCHWNVQIEQLSVLKSKLLDAVSYWNGIANN